MRYYFLREDLDVLRKKVERLQMRVKELGKAQGDAAGQSTENMGHDDAVQETVEMDRGVVLRRLREILPVLEHAEEVKPEGPCATVRFGAIVQLSDGRTLRIGSYMVEAEHEIPTISYRSPLAQAMMRKLPGDEVEFRGQRFFITAVH